MSNVVSFSLHVQSSRVAFVCIAITALKAASRLSALELQLEHGARLSQSPYAECISLYFARKARTSRKPPISISVTSVFLAWSLFQLVVCIACHWA